MNIDIVAKTILSGNDISDAILINAISDQMTNFIVSYNPSKNIDSYVQHSVKIIDTSPYMLILREKMLQLIRKNASLRTNEIDCYGQPERFYSIKVNDDATLQMFLTYSIFIILITFIPTKSYILD